MRRSASCHISLHILLAVMEYLLNIDPCFWLLLTFMVVFRLILQLSLKLQLMILTCGLVYAVTNFWFYAKGDLFRVIIFASLVNFTVCAICCNLDSQITPSTKDFQASTN